MGFRVFGETMNTYAKGYRNEKRCMKDLEAMGYKCWRAKITRYAKNDFYGLFDIVAVHNIKQTLWVQVKSNKLPSKSYIKKIGDFHFKFLPFNRTLLACWVDRKHWKLCHPLSGMIEEVKEIKDSKILEGLK